MVSSQSATILKDSLWNPQCCQKTCFASQSAVSQSIVLSRLEAGFEGPQWVSMGVPVYLSGILGAVTLKKVTSMDRLTHMAVGFLLSEEQIRYNSATVDCSVL